MKTTLLKFLESLKQDEDMRMYDKVNILFQISNEYNVHEILEQIVSDEEIDDILKSYIDDGSNWERIAIFFSDIRLLNQPYYFIDGYGNLSNLSLSTFSNILDDFISEIKFKELMES